MPFEIRDATPDELGQQQPTQQPNTQTTGRFKVRQATPDELGTSSTPAAPKPEDQSFFDRIGGWRGLAATGVRGAAGILGAEGFLPGAGINAAGEGIAEAIEGSPLSLSRMGMEGAIGAVPFGEWIKGGRIAESALRSGALSGVATGARELASGQSLDPTAIATNTAIGAGTGALFGKFLKGGVPAEASKVPDYKLEPTSRTGPGTATLTPTKGGKLVRTPTENKIDTSYNLGPLNIKPDTGAAANPELQGIPLTGTPAEASGRVLKTKAAEVKEATRAAKIAAQAEKDRIAAEQVANAKVGRVAEVGNPKESYSAPIPGGKESVGITYKVPEEEGGIDLSDEESAAVDRIRNEDIPETSAPVAPKPKTPSPSGGQSPFYDIIYNAWRKAGKSHEVAVGLTDNAIAPPNLTTATQDGAVIVKGKITQYPTKKIAAPGVVTDITQKESPINLISEYDKPSNSPVPEPTPDPVVDAIPTEPTQSPLAKVLKVSPKPEPIAPTPVNLEAAAAPGADVSTKDLYKQYKGNSPVEDLKFFLRTQTELPPEARAEGEQLLRQGMKGVGGQGVGNGKPLSRTDFITRLRNLQSKHLGRDIFPGEATGAPSGMVSPVEGAPLDLAREADIGVAPEPTPEPAQPVENTPPPAQPKTFPGQENFPPEVVQAFDKIGSDYISLPNGPEKRAAGAKLAELRNFMSGKGAQAFTPEEQAARLQGTVVDNPPQTPDVAPPVAPETPPTDPNDLTPPDFKTGGDWVNEQTSLLERMKGNKGGINPHLLARLGASGVGALVGAPLGSTMEPDDPEYGALKGALGGGIAGYALASGAQEPINGSSAQGAIKEFLSWRNSGLLSGLAQIKKPLSDMGAYAGLMGERAMAGDTKTAFNLGKEALRVPTNLKEFWSGFKNPEVARQALGETNLAKEESPTGALDKVVRPFAAAQNATSKAMQRAGVSVDEATKALMLGDPTTALARKWLDLQNTPGYGGQFVRAIRPFARIGTNIAERGLERTPGIGMMFEGPMKDKLAKQGMGLGAMAAGAATGAFDQNAAETGDPTSSAVKGLRRASMASYGLPFAIGETLAGTSALEIYNLIPGLRSNVEPPNPHDSALDWVRKLAAAGLDQFIPSILDQVQK